MRQNQNPILRCALAEGKGGGRNGDERRNANQSRHL
jgi:hypothetical protein